MLFKANLGGIKSNFVNYKSVEKQSKMAGMEVKCTAGVTAAVLQRRCSHLLLLISGQSFPEGYASLWGIGRRSQRHGGKLAI